MTLAVDAPLSPQKNKKINKRPKIVRTSGEECNTLTDIIL